MENRREKEENPLSEISRSVRELSENIQKFILLVSGKVQGVVVDEDKKEVILGKYRQQIEILNNTFTQLSIDFPEFEDAGWTEKYLLDVNFRYYISVIRDYVLESNEKRDDIIRQITQENADKNIMHILNKIEEQGGEAMLYEHIKKVASDKELWKQVFEELGTSGMAMVEIERIANSLYKSFAQQDLDLSFQKLVQRFKKQVFHEALGPALKCLVDAAKKHGLDLEKYDLTEEKRAQWENSSE